MKRHYYSLPLLFFFLAAGLGLFLRWQFIAPTPGIRYTFFLHSHSHVMFLGWVMNVIYLSCIEWYCTERDRALFLRLFIILQALMIAMMISFPIQGYGMYSIIFSTVHTLAVMVFVVLFLKKTAGRRSISLWFARIAWVFFFLSTAGPFSLGFLMANEMGNSPWYNLSIYYYLHFQYNGFFFFGIFSLFYQILEQRKIPFNGRTARSFGILTTIACVPAYLLSTLYLQPGIALNFVGGAAAVLQLVAFVIFRREAAALKMMIRKTFTTTAYHILVFIVIMWAVKLLLQLLSAHPDIAQMAYGLRPVVIAYLHLVLLGMITAFLLAWYLERGFVNRSIATGAVAILLVGFLGSQLALAIMPWWGALVGDAISSPIVVLVFSVVLFVGSGAYCAAFVVKLQSSQET